MHPLLEQESNFDFKKHIFSIICKAISEAIIFIFLDSMGLVGKERRLKCSLSQAKL